MTRPPSYLTSKIVIPQAAAGQPTQPELKYQTVTTCVVEAQHHGTVHGPSPLFQHCNLLPQFYSYDIIIPENLYSSNSEFAFVSHSPQIKSMERERATSSFYIIEEGKKNFLKKIRRSRSSTPGPFGGEVPESGSTTCSPRSF